MTRGALTLAVSLALAGGCTAPGDFEAGWHDDSIFAEGGKADGVLDAVPAIAFGESVTGTITGDNLDLYRIELGRTDALRVTARVTDGDLNPQVSLYRGTSTYIDSEAWSLDGGALTKDYVVDTAGTYLLVVRAYRGQGEGSYEMSVACTGGLCAGVTPPPVEREMDFSDVDACLEAARVCAFEALPAYNGRVGDVRARTIFQDCLGSVAGGTCGAACDWTNPDDGDDQARPICDDLITSLPFWADQTAGCVAVLESCMDLCHDADYGYGDSLAASAISMCWSQGFNGTCDGYARDHEACGGDLLADSAGACTAECEASYGAYVDDLDGICDSDYGCEERCDVDVAAASDACGGPVTAARERCVVRWLEDHSAWTCVDGIEDAITFARSATCSYTLPAPFAGTSADLESSVTATRVVDRNNRVYSTMWRQVMHAAVHLFDYERAGRGDSLLEVLDRVDDNTLDVRTLVIDGAEYDWVRFYLGDTEVGVVFEDGSLNMVAEIGDGDVQGCTPL